MMRLLAGLFTAVVIAVAVAGWAYFKFHQRGPLPQATILIIPKGAGLNGIAMTLKEQGVVDYPWLFIAGVRLSDRGRGLRAGEYEVPAKISPKGMMDLLLEGKTIQHPITIVEGHTVKQALAVIADADVLSGEITSPPEEGRLLPETYYVSRGDDRQALVDRMASDLDKTLDALWPGRSPDAVVKDKEETLILASIVERETGVADERPRVAAVYTNRIKRGMRLQADPTVVYGLSDGTGVLDRPLLKKDLETPGPYNTYLNGGLPPGPISLPSRGAIAAVLNPAKTKELYFVADGSGGHAFAETLEQHNRNVARWRRLQRQKAQ